YRGQRLDQKIRRFLSRCLIPNNLLTVIREQKPYHYDSAVLRNKRKRKYLVGYWQNEAYFKPIEAIIRQDFTWRFPLDPVNEELTQQIRCVEAVSLHIRRGDYASNPVATNLHGLLSLDYYVRAAKAIATEV